MMAVSALNGVGACQVREGRLHEAAATSRRGLLLAETQGAQFMITAADMHARLSMFYYEWNDLDSALRHARAALHIVRTVDYRIVLPTVLDIIARILFAQGDLDGARAALLENEQLVVPQSDNPLLKPLFSAALSPLPLAATTEPLAGKQPRRGVLEWAKDLGLSAKDEPSLEHEVE